MVVVASHFGLEERIFLSFIFLSAPAHSLRADRKMRDRKMKTKIPEPLCFPSHAVAQHGWRRASILPRSRFELRAQVLRKPIFCKRFLRITQRTRTSFSGILATERLRRPRIRRTFSQQTAHSTSCFKPRMASAMPFIRAKRWSSPRRRTLIFRPPS